MFVKYGAQHSDTAQDLKNEMKTQNETIHVKCVSQHFQRTQS